MTWLEHHSQSERYAANAEVHARVGDELGAKDLYRLAAEAEQRALQEVKPDDRSRTYSITAVSAVALYFKAAQWPTAQTLAYRTLGSGHLLKFAEQQIEELLAAIKMRQIGVSDAGVLVSAKGGEIVQGGAPLDLILKTVSGMKSLLYRTTEYMLGSPYRRGSQPSREIRDSYSPWILQAPPGSYQFKITVRQGMKSGMPVYDIAPSRIIDKLLRIIDLCATAPFGGLPQEVPEEDYADTFLKLTRDLAPPKNGRFTQLDILSESTNRHIILRSDVRNAIMEAVQHRPTDVVVVPMLDPLKEIRGVLRALHLDADWIEVVTHDGKSHTIDRAGDEIDDTIGSLVNKPVVVGVSSSGTRLTLVNIEPDEAPLPE